MTDDKKSDIFSLLSGRRASPSASDGSAPECAPGTVASEAHESLSSPRPEASATPEVNVIYAASSSADPVSSDTGLAHEGREVRATFIIKEAFNDAMRDLAWYDRKKIKDVLNEALEAYLGQNREKLDVISKLKQTGREQKFP